MFCIQKYFCLISGGRDIDLRSLINKIYSEFFMYFFLQTFDHLITVFDYRRDSKIIYYCATAHTDCTEGGCHGCCLPVRAWGFFAPSSITTSVSSSWKGRNADHKLYKPVTYIIRRWYPLNFLFLLGSWVELGLGLHPVMHGGQAVPYSETLPHGYCGSCFTRYLCYMNDC